MTSKSESETKVTCYDYEKKFEYSDNDMKSLHNESNKVRSEFAKISEGTETLKLKIDSLSQIKEREQM